MKRILQFLVLLFAGLYLTGGPYALPQVCAWTGMLVNYSKTDGLAKAAVDTFSGERPCSLCCEIREAKKRDPQERPVGLPESAAKQRHDLAPVSSVELKAPVAVELPELSFPAVVLDHAMGRAAPLLPPPRFIA